MTMRKHRMNKNVIRLALAAIAAFYVVVGGLWASDYFPLQKFFAQDRIKDALIEEHGFSEAYHSKAYNDAVEIEAQYVRAHPSFAKTVNNLAFYQSLLLWGTVALGVGGGVLFLTRGHKSQPAQTGAQ